MKIANVSGRLAIVTDEGGIDVETASAGRFGPDPQAYLRAMAGVPRLGRPCTIGTRHGHRQQRAGAAGAWTGTGVRDRHELP